MLKNMDNAEFDFEFDHPNGGRFRWCLKVENYNVSCTFTNSEASQNILGKKFQVSLRLIHIFRTHF